MTISSKTKNLLNKYRFLYHAKLAEKRGIIISSDDINLLRSDINIQKKVTRLLFFKKVKEYLNIKNLLKRLR